MNFKKNEAWSFGKSSRSNLRSSQTPGPGNYDTSFLGKSSPKWKMGQKYNMNTKDNYPGAGTYNIPDKHDGPMYSLSKSSYKNKPNLLPAPSDYNPKKEVTLKSNPSYSMRVKPISKDKNDIPGPANYDPKNLKGFVGYKFPSEQRGKSRLNTNPSPNKYDPTDLNKKHYPSYSIRGKYELKNKDQFPGPGNYDTNPKYKPKFAVSKEERGKSKINPNPGVGQYDLKDLHNAPKFSVGKSSRGNNYDNHIPGPNMYSLPPLLGKGGYSLPKAESKEKHNQNPGPGNYNLPDNKLKNFTFKGKYEFKDKNNIPGPQYEYNYNNYVKKSPAYS